ncbi:MAG TPA: helix-turn-helix transcriptional regulator [Longimicrobiales bacterium]
MARAVELLVSPLAHPTVDEWRRAVNRELKELVGADSAGFMLAVSDGPFIYSEEHDPTELTRYPDFMPPPLADGTPLWDSVLQVEVGGIADMYRGRPDIYLGSAYYNEYAGANGAHDTIMMSAAGRTRHITDSASIQLWHARPDGRLFGERELSILRILRPAFHAGVETQRRFGAEHTQLLDLIDALNHPVRVCDLEGRRLHRSRALVEMVAQDPEGDAIVRAVDEAIRTARMALCPGPSPDSGRMAPSVTFETRTSLARYSVVVSLCRNLPGAGDGVLLAAVDRCTAVPMREAELRQAFSLTKSEARVAVLIASGLPNADIAERLCISPHTARRHTERVLLKLGVRSRAEVATRILQ